MQRLTDNKIILIHRSTRLDELVRRYNTVQQAKFYIEHLGVDFSDYQKEHDHYYAMLTEITHVLEQLGRVQLVDRQFLPTFVFGPQDSVVTVGQDGLVANTLKYLDGQPLVAINPDPQRWDGVLLPFEAKDLKRIMPEVFQRKRPLKQVSMALAELNDGQKLYAVNDLFVGPKSHVSARYRLSFNRQEEQHSSSGLIVSTGLGSTGWFKSLVTGARGVSASLGESVSPDERETSFPWDAGYLRFIVREPFTSQTTGANLVAGQVSSSNPLRITSLMPDYGVIFSDGIESDFLQFNSGAIAMIRPAEKTGNLVV
ncbi:MAG TPA: sugar kinase [Chthoniobacterales bacterium]|jgi:NAD kinase